MPSLKIAVCIPTYGDPEVLFMQSLLMMSKHFYEAKLTNSDGEDYDKELEYFIVSSSMLTESRHRLVAEALNWGADYMLWCDADHSFPADALCRLWARNVQVVGANYARRCKPTAPTAAKIVTTDDGQDHKNLVYTTIEKAHDNVLEEVSHLGFGLCLVRMDVFDQLQLKAEEEGKDTFLPLFMFTPTDNYKGMIGEDVYFFRKLRDAGVKVYCDHGVSWQVGHIMKTQVTNAHAVVQEEKWLEQSGKLRAKYNKRIEELEAGKTPEPLTRDEIEGVD